MRKKKKTIIKTPWQSLTAFAAALAMVVSMGFAAGITAEPSHAAGDYEITGKYVTENFGKYSEDWPTTIGSVPTELKTTFSVYKVGYYTHVDGKSVIMLDQAYIDKGIKLPPSYKEGDDEGLKNWLAVAKEISSDVQGEPADTAEDVQGGKTFTLNVDEKGLYLLVGTSAPLENYPVQGQITNWRPQPMLVQVFDGSNRTVNVKPEADIAQNFQVTKFWDCADQGDKDLEDKIRPKSVTVDIYYDKDENNKLDASELYKQVVLDEEHDWTFKWVPRVKEYPNPLLWAIQEQDLEGEAGKYYTHSVADGDTNNTNNLKFFRLTNTFEPAELELTKKLPKGFVNHSDNVSTTFVFEITGFKKNDKDVEEQIYHKYVSLVFDKDGNLTENSKTVKYIPVGLSKLVVREVQAANYKVDKEVKQYIAGSESNDIAFDGKKYTVEFTNDYTGTTQYSGGVINKFKLNDEQSGFTVDGHEGKTLGDSDKN